MAPSKPASSSSASSFAYVLDPVFTEHRAPHAHPECPARIEVILRALKAKNFGSRAQALPIREAREDELAEAHERAYLATLERELPDASGWLDADTFYSRGSWRALLSAAGAAVDLSSAVLDGRFKRGAALVRPPGHHAEADRAMGFCMVNNVAVAAALARTAGARVSILDWDVHHGNGTQHIFETDPNVQYLSIHQYPHYPGTGAASEVGTGPGTGFTVNLAMPAGCGDADYLASFVQVLEPEIRGFRPDIILLSAGFDAFKGDPLAGMMVTISGFQAMTRRLVALSEEVCQGRLVAVLEGGYDLTGLGDSVMVLLEEMMREAPQQGNAGVNPESSELYLPGAGATRAIEQTLSALEAVRGGGA